MGTNIPIPAQADHKTCPLNLLKSFLQIRQNLEGPLFCHFDGTPLKVVIANFNIVYNNSMVGNILRANC
jgi:hypothetical protein